MSCGSARVVDLVSGKEPDIEARDLTVCRYFVRSTTLGPVTVRAGFTSASHFTRVIRNRTGRTPLALRRGLDIEALERGGPSGGRDG
jgi:AraC-like DNA-binding protein